jgi:hypothetical protein
MPIDAASWYDRDPDRGSFYQGDVVSKVPVVFLPPLGDGGWLLLRPDTQHSLEQVLAGQSPKYLKLHSEVTLPDPWRLGKELVFAKAEMTNIILVTQTCDLDHRNFVQVAPVYPASGLLGPARRESLKTNSINHMFFLPADGGQLAEDSFAELSQITSIHKSYLRGANLATRLTSLGRVRFQNQLANLHGRPFGFNTRDLVPQTAEYLCMNCAVSMGKGARRRLDAGTACPPCDSCGEDALWTKVAD